MNVFTLILVLLGVFFLTYAVFLCSKMINAFARDVQKKAGRIMLALIIIFLIGYIIYMVFNYNAVFTDFLVGILLFFTAFFIMLVLHVNHSLIIRLTMKTLELKEFGDKLLAETESLTSSKQRLETIKSMLEDKNRELEMSLKKVSASHLEIAKNTAIEEAKKQEAWESVIAPSGNPPK
jgi:hypothetical protein